MTNQEKFNLDQEKQLNKDLLAAYQQSYREIMVELRKIHQKYEIDGQLTYTEMNKFNRLDKMLDLISLEINKLYSINTKTFYASLGTTYSYNYYYTAFLFEGAIGVGLSVTLLPKDQIMAAIENPISGLTLSETLEKNRREVIVKTKQELTQGMIQGLGTREMASRMKGIYEGDYKKAKRIAQTETTKNSTRGTNKAYQRARDKGIEFTRVWLATLDSRTRPQHRKLDGKPENENGQWCIGSDCADGPGLFSRPENSINCRCTTVAQLDGTELNERRVRDEGVGKYKTYEEWENEKLKK